MVFKSIFTETFYIKGFKNISFLFDNMKVNTMLIFNTKCVNSTTIKVNNLGKI